MESNLTTAEAMVKVAEINADMYVNLAGIIGLVVFVAIIAWSIEQ
jgi:uncharacterized membrane protein